MVGAARAGARRVVVHARVVVQASGRPMTARPVVVGAACRLPGAKDPSSFWAHVERRAALFAPLPPDRWDAAVFRDDLPPGARGPTVAALLDDVELDWRALRLPPVDAEKLHRGEKAAIATMSEALTAAGVLPDPALRARTRLFVAASRLAPDPRTDQARRIRRFELQAPVTAALAELAPERQADIDDILERLFDLAAPPIDPDSLAATASLIAGRIANLLDLGGGHLAIDAGASSSLAALQEAIAALEHGACDAALVCGVSPLVTPATLLAYAHRGWLAHALPRPFHDDADGTALGEGSVAVVLMRGADAGARPVLARVEAVASSFAGLDPDAAAVGRAVEDAARACVEKVGDPRVALVETRAAGVQDVDAAEARAVRAVYDGSAPVVTSSVQTVGFLPACAGMVALLKAVQSLRAGRAIPLRDGEPVALGEDARVAVSDAGFAPSAYHAILSSTAAKQPRRKAAARVVDEPIAIVGLGVVAPGASDVPSFWRTVLDRVDSVGDLPPSRFDVDAMVGSSKEVGAVLRTRLAATCDVPAFSAERYALPARVVPGLDPGVVLTLEAARQALVDAGWREGAWDPARVSVVVGQLPYRVRDVDVERRVLFSVYTALAQAAMAEAELEDDVAARVLAAARARVDREVRPVDRTAVLAQSGVAAAAAVAEANGFSGGALCVDAACASSLAAMDLAVRGLRAGEIDVAVAGGVAFNLLPEYYVALSMLGVLSPRGEPPFSVEAAGFVPGEGAGCTVLMRLADARAQRRRVYATVRAIGASSDGRGVSVFAPSSAGQAVAVKRALDAARVDPGSVDLIEAHGTGTKLGDETEIETYRRVYGARDPGMPASLGTIKSQLGHLSSAAGVVGVVKCALALANDVLPPSLFDVEGRSMITDGVDGLDLATTARGWPAMPGRPRRAAVSSFGLGGVNYHAILEEDAPADPTAIPPPLAPARGARADRFEVALVPLALPSRAPLFPLEGRRVLVVADAGARWRAVADELGVKGADVEVLDASVSTAAIETTIASAAAPGRFECVVDLVGCDDPPDPAADAAAWQAQVEERLWRSMTVIRALYDDFASADPGTRAWAALTRMGGDMGLTGASAARAIGAAHLGLAKGLKQELPHVLARGVDFDAADDARRVARLALAEIEDGNERMEVGYAPNRLVVNLVRAPLPRQQETIRAPKVGDVFLFSGGGRGIVYECALALARAGGRCVVTGRTAPPTGDEPWASMDDDAFAEFKKAELARRRRDEPKLTPVKFAAEFDAVARQRELHANLRRAQQLGVELRYEICDVADAAAVRDCVRRVREKYGRLDGVIHGAMVEWSTSLPKKTRAVVEKTLRAKSQGFLNLLAATQDDPPSTFLSFGSGAGRFGSRGQSDYCAANALLAALTTAASTRAGDRTRFATIDWTAWAETGAAVRDPDIAALVAATGITSIRSSEGVYWFLTELLRGRGREVVVFEERMLSSLLCLGETAEGAGPRTVAFDDTGAPLVPGRWPLVDVVVAHDHDRLAYERTLEVERDAFLAQHLLDGSPILPATFGCELLAEGAALLSPGWEIESALDVQIGVPVKLHRGEPITLRVSSVLVDRTEDRRIVACESRSDLVLKGKALQRDRLHHAGRYVLRRTGSAEKKQGAVPDFGSVVRARSFFHMAKDPVCLGPLFCRAEWIQVRGQEVTADVKPPRQRDVLASSSYPFFHVDPLTMDAAFQVAANWDGVANGWVSIPTGIAGLWVGRPRERGEAARVHARAVRVEDPVVHYDVDVVGAGGDLLMEVRGLKLHRVARLPGRD